MRFKGVNRETLRKRRIAIKYINKSQIKLQQKLVLNPFFFLRFLLSSFFSFNIYLFPFDFYPHFF